MPALRHNRDFVLLQSGQLLSTLGGSFTAVAYPLLILGLTGSPAKAGLVSAARIVGAPLLILPAGIAADRLDRRWIMLAADAVRALAVGSIAVLVALDPVFWPLPLLAFLEGAGEAFFAACSGGALRAVVPPDQLADAVSVQTGRSAVVGIVGPPVGGALFGVGRAVPFAADAASYLFSFASLAALSTPLQEDRDHEPARIRERLAEGWRFLMSRPFLRVTTFLYGVENLTIPATTFVLVVVAHGHGLTGGEIGLLLSAFSACILAGSTLARSARRRLSPRAIMLLELYLGLGTIAYVLVPSVWVLAGAILPQAVALPITDSVVVSRRLQLTPDRLLGRVEAVRVTIARGAAPAGPLVAGLLLASISSRATVAVFAAIAVVLLAWGLLTPALRER
jgi:MFS family permease